MKNVIRIAIVPVFFMLLIGWGWWLEKENKKHDFDYPREVDQRMDTLVKIINSQRDIQRYILSLKKDVDSLKTVHKNCH